MTDILCNWLNNDVNLSRKVDTGNFTKEFSTGYLIGEVLSKYQLQDDFDQFSQNRMADAKLNNFTRMEPVLHLLGIEFDTNTARDIMTEKHGVATRLMYEVFIALSKKEKANLTGVAMETMRPAAPAKLEGVESLMYKERLKHMTPRQTDLNLDALGSRFKEKRLQMETVAFQERFEDQEKHEQQLQDHRQNMIQKYKENKAKQSEMLARIQAATVEIPQTPPSKTTKAILMQRKARKAQEAENMRKDIEIFEEKLKRTLPPSKSFDSSDMSASLEEKAEVAALPDSLELIKPASNDEYINKIRKRLNEDASARAEREKRRRKVLVDQLKAHEAQEESRREEMLVNRLMRQSQQERRVAVQLLQARHEKDIIRQNRLFREKQYEERRLKDFQEALNQEAEMARLAKLEYIEQTKKDKELHDKITAERAEATYSKHYEMCSEIMDNVVDYTTKIGEYRELTNKLLPPKLMREWTSLFVEGKPLYEQADELPAETEEPTPEQILEMERQALLDEGDFNEYRHMMGEWQPPADSEISGVPQNNKVLGHIVQRLFDIVHPPSPPPPPPEFPPFPIKACLLGKLFSGKSTCAKNLAETHRLQVLNAEDLINEAIEAHKNGETIPEPEEIVETESPAMENTQQNNEALSAEGSQQPPGSATDVPPGTSESVPDNKQTENASTDKLDEGAEKTDPEKPFDNSKETTEDDLTSVKTSSKPPSSKPASKRSTKESSKPKATPRAKLGAKAMKNLKKGKSVDDPLIIEILVEAIRRIPEDTGWVLDGFPATYSQAKMVEKALSGLDTTSRESSKLSLTQSKGKMKKSQLAADPKPSAAAPEPSSGINVVVLFELEDQLCLKRSAGRTVAVQSDEQYQQEFKPPPDGSATGIGKVEKVMPVEDPAHDMEQVQHRLTAFQDSWPKMEKWFTKYGSLKKVDASQEQHTVFLEVEHMLEETLNKLQGKDQEESVPVETEPEKPAEPEPKPPTPPPEPAKEEERSRPPSKKGSRTGSAKRSGSRGSKDSKGKRDKSESPKRGSKGSPGSKTPKGSRGASPKSPGKRGKSGKRSKTPPPEPEPEPEPQEPPGPAPGSDEWEYVNQPIDDELAHILAPHWENVEMSYIENSKAVFSNLRSERENIYRYLYQIRQDYLAYLRRPDSKQEFIAQWQKDYNEIPDDMRDDEETRAEQHQGVDNLRDRLWNICDERKEQAEREHEAIKNDGWLDDRLGLLSNQYITLMQAEVDRYQDTIRMLKDYYRGMEGKIPDELNNEYVRIPLIELPAQVEEEAKPGTTETGRSGSGEPSPVPDENKEVKSSPSKSVTPSGKRKSKADVLEETSESGQEDGKTKIPLVPRRPVSPDTAGTGKGGKPDKAKGKKDAGTELPEGLTPPTDLDEKLLFDAHLLGVVSIDRMVAAEKAAKEAEEEAEKEKDREKEREREKQAAASKGKKGGKKGAKSRSPSPKKGKGAKEPEPQPTPIPPEEESEEDKEKKKIRENMRMEFFAAIETEATSAKNRLDLVKAVSYIILQDLKTKSGLAFKDMNDWLGARFLKEMESIDHISEVMRHAIEAAERIKEQLMLQQEDFMVESGLKVLRTPSPPPRDAPMEQAVPDAFTVNQLMNMYKQFKMTAPDGAMSVKSFQETVQDLVNLTHGTEQMPDLWLNVSQPQIDEMGRAFSADGEFVDWRTFLLAASHPWPVPTQTELLDTLQRFRDMDQKESGLVFREQFDRVELWFTAGSKPGTPIDPSEPIPYNRIEHFKAGLFDIFANMESDPPQLNYVQMLMYFSADPDPYEGFLRALSVSAGTHMPRLVKRIQRAPSQGSLVGSEEFDPHEREDTSDIPESANDAKVPIEALHRVFRHGQNVPGDTYRFSVEKDPEEMHQREKLSGIYQELGSESLEPLPLAVLLEHPGIQDMVSIVNTYKAVDLRNIATSQGLDNADVHSMKTME